MPAILTPGQRPLDVGRGSLGDARRRPEQIDPQRAVVGHRVEQGGDQVGAGDPLGHLAAEQAGRPEDGGAIDEDQTGVVVGGPQALMVLQHHDVIDVRRDDEPAL